MSHDIYFASHATPFHPPSFAAYVDLHPWLSWTRGSAESESAEITYFHPNTEVTFVYERFVASSGPRWSVVMTVDYGRPHVFGLEAAIELERFTRHFGLDIIDVQIDEDESRPFDEVRFLASYEEGNRAGVRTRLQSADEDSGPLRTLPTEVLQRSWRWNWEVDITSESMTPCVSYIDLFGVAHVAVVWPEVEDFVLPEVDLLVVWRRGERRPRVTPFSDVQDLFTSSRRVSRSFDGWHIASAAKIERQINTIAPLDGPIHQLKIGAILNREWC